MKKKSLIEYDKAAHSSLGLVKDKDLEEYLIESSLPTSPEHIEFHVLVNSPGHLTFDLGWCPSS